jgi:alkanesulfonate monooxygenase SsuD/methylene tetrahydromethanopterin reductase-like flavin-dependent oxidoreductase (luciferase family)
MTSLPPAAEFRAGALLLFTGPFVGVTDHAQLVGAVDAALAAEAEGFDDVWIGEHHYFQCSNPSAIAFAGYLLGRTERIRVGTAVTILPLHNPVHVAEQAAVLDHLSGGRFDLGVGRGAATAVYEVMSSLEHWERGMPEALGLLMESFTGAVLAESDLYRFREVSPQPRPWTRPHPPVLVAAGSEATLALSARRGLPCMFFLDDSQDEAAVSQLVEHHAALAAEHGHPGPWPHTILVYAQVADTDEEAAHLIRGPLRESIRAVDVGYVWLRESGLVSENDQYLEDVIAHHAVGTPATCIDRLTSIVERSGVCRVILAVESAATPAAVVDNVQRLGREVLPQVRRRLEATLSQPRL